MRDLKQPVPIQSYADEGAPRPRFGIRSKGMAAGNRLVHRHDYFEVLFFASEASAQRIALRECVTRRGSIFFISPMTPHQVRFDADATCFVLYFDLAFIRPDITTTCVGIDLDLLGRVPELAPFVYQRELDFVLPPATVSSIQAMCARMLRERESPRLCSKEVVRANLMMLLAEVAQQYEPQIRSLMQSQPPSGGGERHVKGVMEFIDRNLGGRASLTDAARSVAVSPNYLATLLKRETGKTFVELMTERRIERAGDLLAFGNLRISQIAQQAGFADVDYFSRRFRQVTGLSPSEFRAKYSIRSEMGGPVEAAAPRVLPAARASNVENIPAAQ
jgi:AraC-like DNA-binding protein